MGLGTKDKDGLSTASKCDCTLGGLDIAQLPSYEISMMNLSIWYVKF